MHPGLLSQSISYSEGSWDGVSFEVLANLELQFRTVAVQDTRSYQDML